MRHSWIVWISLFIAIGVIINEVNWIGRSELAGVLITISIAVILPGIYLLINKKT